MQRVVIETTTRLRLRCRVCARGQASVTSASWPTWSRPPSWHVIWTASGEVPRHAQHADYSPGDDGSGPAVSTMGSGTTSMPGGWATRRWSGCGPRRRAADLRPHAAQRLRGRSILARERKAVGDHLDRRCATSPIPVAHKTRRDRRSTGGQALMGALFTALRQRGIDLWLQSPLQTLTRPKAPGHRRGGAARGREVTVRAPWACCWRRRFRAQPGDARAVPAAVHRPGLDGLAAGLQHRR